MPKPIEAMEGLTFGADPELFIINPDGEFVSAHGMIPGDKENPYKVDGGAVQVDGMAAEFNIDPVTTYKEFKDNIVKVRKQLKSMLPKGYDLVAVPTATFSKAEWERTPEEAKILGCSPDFDAWRRNVNPVPQAQEFVRHAGGHLHVGWTNGADTSDPVYTQACLDLVKQFDWFLGAWSVHKDPDNLRRSAYGKAGAMRFKPYGVEYRTLSNFWLNGDNNLLLELWNRMQSAIHNMEHSFLPTEYSKFCPDLVKSINESRIAGSLNGFSWPIKVIHV